MNNIFRTPTPIEISITLARDTIVSEAVSILNKIAEARYDGQNTKYVNNMQPEIDFEQDRNIVYGFYEEGIANIARRIEPYVKGYTDEETAGTYIFSLVFPENWKSQEQHALETKMRNYLVNFIIANWMEKVSVGDTEWSLEKSASLLRAIKGICELRQGKVHRGWNTTY